MKKFDKIVYLGSALETSAQRRAASRAYKNPERALAEMDRYLWAVPTVPTPFVGDAPAPGLYGRSRINSQQFRHPSDIEMPKPAGVYRIFFTGSSTGFSSGAPDEETTISGYLEKFLNTELGSKTGLRYEVINAANAGWASTHERIWIEVRISRFEPDLVIQYSGNNEAHWGVRNFRTDWMRSYAADLYWGMVAAFHRVYTPAPLRDVTPRESFRVDPKEIADILNTNVDQTIHFLSRRNRGYVFILHPTIGETKKILTVRERAILDEQQANAGAADYFTACYGAMRGGLKEVFGAAPNVMNGSRAFWADHSDVFDDRSADEEIFLDAYHFGDRGNEIMARRLLEDLIPFLRNRPVESTGTPPTA